MQKSGYQEELFLLRMQKFGFRIELFLLQLQMEELAEIIQKFKTNITVKQEEVVHLHEEYLQVILIEIRMVEVLLPHQGLTHQ